MLQSHSQQTNKISLFQRFSLFVEYFYSSNLSLHNFFLSLLLLIYVCLPGGCGSSVAERLCAIQAVLGSIPGGDQIFLILYCLKKPVKEREYI